MQHVWLPGSPACGRCRIDDASYQGLNRLQAIHLEDDIIEVVIAAPRDVFETDEVVTQQLHLIGPRAINATDSHIEVAEVRCNRIQTGIRYQAWQQPMD
jgi:hypothetical protein